MTQLTQPTKATQSTDKKNYDNEIDKKKIKLREEKKTLLTLVFVQPRFKI